MIYPTTNPLIIPKLVELAKVIPDLPGQVLDKLLIEAIVSKDAKIYVDEKDDDVRGFIFATIADFDGQPSCFVQVCVVKPVRDERYICFELLTKVKLWAKENKLEYIYFITRRDPKGFEKKYHFDYYGTVLRQKVSKEE